MVLSCRDRRKNRLDAESQIMMGGVASTSPSLPTSRVRWDATTARTKRQQTISSGFAAAYPYGWCCRFVILNVVDRTKADFWRAGPSRHASRHSLRRASRGATRGSSHSAMPLNFFLWQATDGKQTAYTPSAVRSAIHSLMSRASQPLRRGLNFTGGGRRGGFAL